MAVLSPEFLADLNDKVINPSFEVARTNIVGILRTVSYGAPRVPETGSKLSWQLQSIGAGGSTVQGATLAGVTTINVATGEGVNFRKGMLVSVKNSDEVILVESVSGDALTVVRGVGGTTAVDIADQAILTIDSVGREENSTGLDDNIFEPEVVFNHFQTMDTQLTFSRRALATAQIGDYNAMNAQIAERIEQLTIQMNRALIRGVRLDTTVGGNKITYTGGLTWFMNQAGAYSVDNAGSALTLTKLDDLTEQITLRGGMTNTIAVNTRLARVLSGLVETKYTSQRLSEVQSDKGALTEIVSDLPLIGNINRIVIDTNLNDDELIMYDSSKLSIIPMASGNGSNSGNWRTMNATQPAQDGESIRIVGDFGLEFLSFKTHACRLSNIG